MSRVTFDPLQVLPWGWKEVKGEVLAVNKAEYTSAILWTAGQ